LDSRFNFSFLRTTPARNPRTECCCQPVACIIAAIVVPADDCNIAITRDCLEAASAFFPASEGATAGCAGFILARAGLDLGEDFFADGFFAGFGIGDLHSVHSGVVPHHRSPTSAKKPAGQDP